MFAGWEKPLTGASAALVPQLVGFLVPRAGTFDWHLRSADVP